MNGRDSRKHWIRNLAWALLALSWPVSGSLAASVDDSDAPPRMWGGPPESERSTNRDNVGSARRPKIPPPRIFSPGSVPPRRTISATRIPPPRVYSAEEIKARQPVPSPTPVREESSIDQSTAAWSSTPVNAVPPAPVVQAAEPQPSVVTEPAATSSAPVVQTEEPQQPVASEPAPAPAAPVVQAEEPQQPVASETAPAPAAPVVQVEEPQQPAASETAPAPAAPVVQAEEPQQPAASEQPRRQPPRWFRAEEPQQPAASEAAPAPAAPVVQMEEPQQPAVSEPAPAMQAAEETREPAASQPVAGTESAVSQALNTLGVGAPGSDTPNSEPSASPVPTPAAVEPAVAPSAAQAISSPSVAPPAVPADTAAPVASTTTPPDAVPVPASARFQGQDASKSTELKQDGDVAKTSCPTCGTFHSQHGGHVFSSPAGCGSGNCIPGREPCNLPAHECETVCGAFLTNLYQAICCPDPCYEPRWEPAAYASFFADYARPRTVTRLRYDNLEAMTRPDRNQFWINQVKPVPQARSVANPTIRLQQLYLYQEAASERGSMFVAYPYRQVNSNFAPTQAGFGDVYFGVKSLLFDQEILQVSFQLTTTMPSGNFTNNLGIGQFALDPAILASLKLSPTTYFQGQFGNWIPLGGPGVNRKLSGGMFYWLMSLNQVLWYMTPDSPLIATLEMDGWSFEDGGYTGATRPVGPGPHPHTQSRIIPDGGGVSYFNIGPGLRQSICNRVDFGGAITWATDTAHWAQPWFRCEVRFLF